MRKLLFIIIPALCILISPLLQAKSDPQTDHKSIKAEVRLLRIKALTTSEKEGDELFLHITEYLSNGKTLSYDLPKDNKHWDTKDLSKVNNYYLLSLKLRKGEAATIIFSLMEQDFKPWNTKDVIGSVRLRVMNNKGALESSWGMTNLSISPIVVHSRFGNANKFTIMGDGGRYEMYFLLKEKK